MMNYIPARMKYLLLVMILNSFNGTAQPAAKLTTSLDSLFQSYFKLNEPGGAILLVKDNKIIYKKAFGIRDINSQQPITSKTLFNTGSVSKTFVAFGILKLAAENKLSLEDDLYKYFPEFKNAGIAKQVKLVHLLTHTSGLPDSRKIKAERDFYIVAKDEENFAPLLQTESLKFEPGTKYEYSNPAFNGLALVIQKITAKKWQDYIRETIFLPAGMTTSTITDGAHPASGVAHGYIKNKKGEFEELDYGEEPTFAAAGNGGVWSSVEELWKYEQAIQQNTFLDSAWINKSRTIYPFPGWKDPVAHRLGLSWFLTKEKNLAMTGHTGSQGGFVSDYCWIGEKKVFYVLLCNIPRPVKEIRDKLFGLLQQHWLK